MNHLDVFADFLIVASAYGIKTHEGERVSYGWRSCCSQDQCSKAKHGKLGGKRERIYKKIGSWKNRAEICYNIPYVEEHLRRLADPWSLRQTGAYQQLRNGRQSSRCIMLNLTAQMKRALEKSLDSKSRCCHLAIHAELLVLLGSNWPDYVEYLSRELRKHVSRLDTTGLGGILFFFFFSC